MEVYNSFQYIQYKSEHVKLSTTKAIACFYYHKQKILRTKP